MTYNTYTKTGPFTNGGAPGISAAFLNALETFCFAGWFDSAITSDGSGNETVKSLLAGGSGITVNGGTSGSGSVTLWQPMTGSGFKLVVIWMTNYKSGTVAQTIALPTAFVHGALVWTGGVGVSGSGGIQLLSSGSAQTINLFTALSGGGGSTSAGTSQFAYGLGECTNAFDTIQYPINTSSAHTAHTIIIGS